MTINNTKQRGFTLIETLIAISILMMAIAGPLTVSNKAYNVAINAKKQAIATSLAQETVEYINYIKDNRDATWGTWEPGTSFFSEVREPYRSCADDSNPCFAVAGLPALPAGFSREYYFDVINPIDEVLLTVSILWIDGSGNHRVAFIQDLTNQHR